METKDSLEDQTIKLRNESGTEESSDPLVSFLYELMRDYVPCGTIEKIMHSCNNDRCIFTNGYLARYAKNITKRLIEGKESL